MNRTKIYRNEELTVYWNPSLCTHSTICLRRLPKVFDPARTPWVELSGAPMEQVIDTIEHCPSGALSYTRHVK